jgi:flagellar basal body-associated protein FliL
MDLVAALSGFFAAASIVWILLGLFIALVLGTLMAAFFVSIFYGASRLAHAAEKAYSHPSMRIC